VPVPGAAPTDWLRLATRVTLPAGATRPFSASGSQLQLRVAVGAGTAAHPVLVSTTIATSPQADSTTAPVTCL
jgi:hypothetical protein